MASTDPPVHLRRDLFLDFCRNFSLLGVVFVHWVLAFDIWAPDKRTFVPDGLERHGAWWAIYAFLWMIPAFFFVGGAVNYGSALRARDLRIFYVRRLWRIVIPVATLIGVLLVVNALLQPSHLSTCGSQYAVIFMDCVTPAPLGPLWFLLLYVPFVLVTPLAARIWRLRHGWLLLPLLVAGVVASDLSVFVGGSDVLLIIPTLGIWFVSWLFGFWYAQGKLQRVPSAVWWVVLAAAVALHATMVLAGPFTVTFFPPTSLLVVHQVAGIAWIMLMRNWITRVCETTRFGGWITGWVSTRVMTIYIWHTPAQMLAYVPFIAAGFVFADEPSLMWVRQRLFLGLVPLPILALFVWTFGRVEDIPIPSWLTRERRRRLPGHGHEPAPPPATQTGNAGESPASASEHQGVPWWQRSSLTRRPAPGRGRMR